MSTLHGRAEILRWFWRRAPRNLYSSMAPAAAVGASLLLSREWRRHTLQRLIAPRHIQAEITDGTLIWTNPAPRTLNVREFIDYKTGMITD